MNTRHIPNLIYLLLIVLVFAASCEDTQAPNDTDPIDQDSLHRADSIHVADSLDRVDSLHRLDSLAPLSHILPAPHTLDYSLFEHERNIFSAITKGKLGGPALYADYSPEPGSGLSLVSTNFLLIVKDLNGAGTYPIEAVDGDRIVQIAINGKFYVARSGSIRITKFDLANHLVSGEFNVVLKDRSSEDTSLTALGAFEDVDLNEYARLQSAHIIANYSTFTGTADSTTYDESHDRMIISSMLHLSRPGCRFANADVTYRFHMEIPQPRVGLFVKRAATWSESYSVSELDSRCSSYNDGYASTGQDSLMITSWDPQNREISGWFTVGGHRAGELQKVTWRKYF